MGTSEGEIIIGRQLSLWESSMSLAGSRLGPYEIVTLVGSGGMGEVYRARDPRLGRDVAIKVLPTAFSADPERLRRFEQEARAAAALTHPGILAVYDLGTEAGAPYIVSELLEGETLRDRLVRASAPASGTESAGLPVRKTVDYAIQLARGLSAAHERGIVHRDLKPENVFITTDGRVKILDFGLAKLTEPNAAMAGAGSLPTVHVETQPGMMLGTMGYMAPEQVRGQTADHRADIFAFGAILYEMVSGQRAFRGATPADTISAILDKDPPDLPMADRHIPPALARVVDRCLEKSPAARFQSTHDLAFALEGVSGHSESGTVIAPRIAPRKNRREQLAWGVAGVLALVAVAAVAAYVRRPIEEPPAIRFSLHAPDGVAFVPTAGFAISPDGRRIVFPASRTVGGAQLLWVRSLDSLEARTLPGTEFTGPPASPFWSPDGRFIAFFADGKLKKIDITGGGPQSLCDVTGIFTGGTWGRDDVILFATTGAALLRVSAAGGQPTPATTLDRGRQEANHRRPSFLPDGRHFTYVAQPGNAIYIGSLDSSETTRLLNADSAAVYSAGHLLFVRQGTLLAQTFDAGRLKVSGDVVPIAESIGSNAAAAGAGFAASESGVVVYALGATAVNANQLKWFDRSGKELGSIGTPADFRGIELSPDERRLAEHQHEAVGGGDLWMRDLARETTTRLTFGAHNSGPVWSPDGTRIAFGANPPPPGQQPLPDGYGGTFNLYEKRADGTGDATLLLDSATSKLPQGWKQPTSWSPDGQLLVFEMIDPKTSFDLWALPLTGDRTPRPLVRSEFQEAEGAISPDGRWLAYTSNETRRLEIYVRPLSGSAGKWQISTTGGAYPRWRHDGKELFFVSRDRKVTAVDVNASGSAIEFGRPRALFEVRLAPQFFTGNALNGNANAPWPYVVTRDGQRFLVSVDTSQPATEAPLTVVVNWQAALRK
jgi:Tol biopolymer transport system component